MPMPNAPMRGGLLHLLLGGTQTVTIPARLRATYRYAADPSIRNPRGGFRTTLHLGKTPR